MSTRFDPDELRALEERLTTRLEALAPRPRPLAAARVRTEVAETPQRGGFRSRVVARRPAIAWSRAALAAVVVVAAVVIGIGIGQSGVLPIGRSTARPTEPTPTAVPSATAKLPVSTTYTTWNRVAMPDPTPHVYGGELANAAVSFKGSYYAFGTINGGCCDGSFTTDTRALVWSSTDGTTWSLEPNRAAFAGGRMRAAATGDDRIVVVGTLDRPSETSPGEAEHIGAMWTSTDGTTWRLVTGVPTFTSIIGPAGGNTMFAMANTDNGPEMWWARDGVTWSRMAGAGSFGPGTVNSFHYTPQVGFVAVGWAAGPTAPDGSPTDVAVAWVSGDGKTWTRTPDQPSLRNAMMTDIGYVNGYLDGRLVAVGTDWATGASLAWVSTDGLRWTKVADNALAADCGEVRHVISVASGLLAVGSHGCDQARFRAWTSPDGLAWSVVNEDQAGLRGTELTVNALSWRDANRNNYHILAVGYGSVAATFHPAPMAWLVDP